MDGTERRLREQLCRFGQSLFERGLTAGASGNLSARLPDGQWLCTPTGTSLGRLDPASLSLMAADGTLQGGAAPTKELPLHAAVYAAREGAQAVVHLHSTHATALSVRADLDPSGVLPPLSAYAVMKVGRLPLIPYHRPGDPRVAEAIHQATRVHAAVLLANHGPVVAGASLEAAVDAAEELEEAAKLFNALEGRPLRLLTEAQIDELRREFGARW